MNLEIDVAAEEPVYEQIVRQIQQAVRSGELAPGTGLPSIRQLATDLDLNPNTVAKAFKILEGNRVIRTAGRKGTFVNADASSHVKSRNERDARYLFADLVAKLDRLGLSGEQIEAAFRAATGAKNG
jgi:GntR family transcriptional regulator